MAQDTDNRLHLKQGERIRILRERAGASRAVSRAGVCAARHLMAGCDIGVDNIPRNVTPLVGVGAPGFRVWVHMAERDAGLGRIWPHLLRHEFSNRVAAHGDPEAWRRLMNHADLSQWARYVAIDDERLRSALTPLASRRSC